MTYQKYTLYLFLAFFLGLSQATFASHIYSTEITYRCIGGNQYIIELEALFDCSGIPPSTQLFLNRQSTNCGINNNIALPRISMVDATPICLGGSPTCGSGYGFYRCVYADTFSFSACSDWVVSYNECCRSGTISNLSNPSSTAYYSEIRFDNTIGCNISPKYTALGSINICRAYSYTYHPNAYDLDGDSLVFSLVNTLQSSGSSASYFAGFSGVAPFGPTSPAVIDPTTGNLSFTISFTGSFVVAFQVLEYRNGVLIGTHYKDLIIKVINCTNASPNFTISNVQGGILENNIFYINGHGGLSFDITATDANATDTLTFSSDISNIGGSFSSTGANPAISSFNWNGTNTTPQEFMVQIVDNKCYPQVTGSQTFGFAIIYQPCNPAPIQAIVAADSALNICVSCAMGTVLTIDTLLPPFNAVYGNISVNGSGCLVYQAGSNYQVQESFWVYFGNQSGGWMDSIWLDITTVSCVWPGDADTNKIVNNFDLLPLGLGYGETGAARPNASLAYTCQPALDFANSTPTTNINYKNSDTDGNGLVNADDTMAIVLNWGQIHVKNISTAPLTAIPFYAQHTTALAGQTVQIPIMLGDSSVLADSIYGVAFTINYDETMTDTSSVSVDFNTSWLGAIGSDMISVQKDFYTQGQIQVGVVRTDHTNRDGSGQIGTLNLTIKDDILKSATQRLDLQISNVRIITNIETERTAATPPTDVLVTLITNTNHLENKAVQINVFPNPTNSLLHIQSNDMIKNIKLYSITGQEIYTEKINGLNTSISTQYLENGLYLLQIQTDNSWTSQKVEVRK